jgi:hypothetical protein
MFQLELLRLKPKRVLFLTGMKYAQDFLDLTYRTVPKAQTVVSGNPRMYKRSELVKSILNEF